MLRCDPNGASIGPAPHRARKRARYRAGSPSKHVQPRITRRVRQTRGIIHAIAVPVIALAHLRRHFILLSVPLRRSL